MVMSPEDFASQYPSWFEEFNMIISGSYESESSEEVEMEPVWYNFIVNNEMESWAIIATYDEEFELFYLWTPEDDVCALKPDWKTENNEDNIWGFYVYEEDGLECRFILEQNWTYASYTYDEETMEPISVVGPWGNDWEFISPEDF
jgi:hypothetical protein